MNTLFSGTGALFAAFAVISGAFGAHGLKGKLTENMLNAYQTGVEYQMYHALALILLAVVMHLQPDNLLLKWSGICFIGGIILFSGSLYILALTDIRFIAMVTPMGGLVLILGWIIFAYTQLARWS